MRQLSLSALVCFLMLIPGMPAHAQDASAGKTIAQQRCQACHGLAAGAPAGLGPNLVGVFGKKAGVGPFPYSLPMKNYGTKWDAAALDRFLENPLKIVPGTTMVITVPSAKDRADVIAYLKTLK